MKRFRVTGKYEANGESISMMIPAEDEERARDRAAAEGIRVQEIQIDEGAGRSATLADTLLYVGFAGAIITCVATAGLAVYAFVDGSILGGLLCFPCGFLMAAANAMLFWRVLDLSAGVTNDN